MPLEQSHAAATTYIFDANGNRKQVKLLEKMSCQAYHDLYAAQASVHHCAKSNDAGPIATNPRIFGIGSMRGVAIHRKHFQDASLVEAKYDSYATIKGLKLQLLLF